MSNLHLSRLENPIKFQNMAIWYGVLAGICFLVMRRGVFIMGFTTGVTFSAQLTMIVTNMLQTGFA
jgi:hypothetical protein